MKYNFHTMLERGKTGENLIISALIERGWQISRVTDMTMQKRGIDAIVAKNGIEHTVEFKTDGTACRTGNAFIEIDQNGKPGWAYYTEADYIFYLLPVLDTIYVVSPDMIRMRLDRWKNKYKQYTTEGTNTTGILVPITEFKTITKQVIKL